MEFILTIPPLTEKNLRTFPAFPVLHDKPHSLSALVLAGIDLIFFLVAGMFPDFRCRMRRMFITHIFVVAEQFLH